MQSLSAVRCEDAASHQIQWETVLPEGLHAFVLTIADLDDDGASEVVGSTHFGGAFVLEGSTGALRWGTPYVEGSDSEGERLRVADLDDDSGLEILVGGRRFPTGIGGLTVFDGTTGDVDFGPLQVAGGVIETTQLDTGPFEVVAATADGTIVPVNLSTGELGPALYAFEAPVHAIRAADLTRDGTPDLAGFSADRLRVIDGALGQEIWSSDFLGTRSGYPDGLWIVARGAGRAPCVLVDTYVGIHVFESPLQLLFEDGLESGDTGAWSNVQP